MTPQWERLRRLPTNVRKCRLKLGRSSPRGEHRGEHPLRARCSPWIGRLRVRLGQTKRDSRAPNVSGNCRLLCGLRPRCRRAALCAARLVAPPWSGRQLAGGGVSDHPKRPLGVPRPRPATWSLTPPLKGDGAPCRRRHSTGNYGEFDAQPARELEGFLDAVFTLVPVLKSERLTPRGGPRQTAVVGALRERQVVSRNRRSMNRCPPARLTQVSPHGLLASEEAEQQARRSVPRRNPLRRRQ